MLPSRRRTVPVAVTLTLTLTTLSWWRLGFIDETAVALRLLDHGFGTPEWPSTTRTAVSEDDSQSIVVASTKSEDTSWVTAELPHLSSFIYVADDPTAPLHPPENKGHESMMYLTYIIDHYDNLSSTTIFTHAQRDAWHNNDLFDFSLPAMIRSLSAPTVQRRGFFNLRCHHESGCPDHIRPFALEHEDKVEEGYFGAAWAELHGASEPVPSTIAAACCAQFAVSRAAIHAIPRARWQHYRDWLLHTPLPDSISGRIWEFTWHYVLTGQAVLCPSLAHCYCDGYGLCFEGDAELMAWLAMKEVEALADQVRTDLQDRGKNLAGIDQHLWQRVRRPARKWLHEAERRGGDPDLRARLSGRHP